ncbi:gtp-binding protein rho2 [Cladorrhinum sp. PSN259]|nr:gtp-binding protein rho2 [Cladorrhinum sp. PSN259]
MEAAGLALGVAGLAGLFSSCVSCYQLVQRGARFGKDYKILETKFSNQELRLLTWGQACGLHSGQDGGGGGGGQYDTRFDNPVLRGRITATLECIRDLFKDEAELRKRFGLKAVEQVTGLVGSQEEALTVTSRTTSVGVRGFGFSGSTRRRSLLFWRKSGSSSSSSGSGVLRAAAWAISDRAKFAELVQHLKDFNDDLDALTKPLTDIVARQRQIVEREISEIDDLETLEEMAQASRDDEDVISDTVSLRISSIKSGRSVRATTFTGSRDTRSFKTALTSAPVTITETIEEMIERYNFVNPDPKKRQKPLLKKYKCVVAGDGESGKTRLLSAFVYGHMPEYYIPTLFEDYTTDCKLDGHPVHLSLWDTTGQEDFARLMPLTFSDAHVVILCFRANNPTAKTKANILDIWSPRIQEMCPAGVPIVLVGLNYPAESDDEGDDSGPTRFTELEHGQQFVPRLISENIGAPRYFFCDPQSGFAVDDVFEYVRAVSKK